MGTRSVAIDILAALRGRKLSPEQLADELDIRVDTTREVLQLLLAKKLIAVAGFATPSYPGKSGTKPLLYTGVDLSTP